MQILKKKNKNLDRIELGFDLSSEKRKLGRFRATRLRVITLFSPAHVMMVISCTPSISSSKWQSGVDRTESIVSREWKGEKTAMRGRKRRGEYEERM